MPDARTARRIEYVPLDDVRAAERNPKRHDDALIGASVGRFGFVEPAVIDERTGRLVAGHGRTDELRRRRDAGEEPPDGVEVDDDGRWLVPLVRGWASRSDDEAHAAGIALNRVGERGGWVVDELYAELDRLAHVEDGLLGLGFDQPDIDDLLVELQERSVEFNPESAFTGPAHNEPSIAEKAQRYAGKNVRSLVLDYVLDDFDELAATCARLRRHLELGTNAELVLRLVRDRARELPADDTSG